MSGAEHQQDCSRTTSTTTSTAVAAADIPNNPSAAAASSPGTTACSCCTTARRELGFTVCDFMHDFLPRGTSSASPDLPPNFLPAGEREADHTDTAPVRMHMHVMNMNMDMDATACTGDPNDITTSANVTTTTLQHVPVVADEQHEDYDDTISRDFSIDYNDDDDDENNANVNVPSPAPQISNSSNISSNSNASSGSTIQIPTPSPVRLQGRRLDSDATLIYSQHDFNFLSSQQERERERERELQLSRRRRRMPSASSSPDANGIHHEQEFSFHHHRDDGVSVNATGSSRNHQHQHQHQQKNKWQIWCTTWEVKVAAATFLVYIVSIAAAVFVMNKGSADEVLIGSLLDKIQNLQRQLRVERGEFVRFQQEQEAQLSSQRHRCTALMRQAAAEPPPGSSLSDDDDYHRVMMMEPGVCAPERIVTFYAEFHNMGSQLEEWTPIQLVDQLSQFTGIHMVIPPKCSYSYSGAARSEDVGLEIKESFSCIVFFGAPDSGHMLLNAYPARKYMDMDMKLCLENASDIISSIGSNFAVGLHELFNPPLYANSPVEILWSIHSRQQRGDLNELQRILSSMDFPWKKLVYSGKSAEGRFVEIWDLFDSVSALQNYQSFLNTISSKDRLKIPRHILPDRAIFVGGVFKGSLEKYTACTEYFVHSALISHPDPLRIAFVGNFFPGVVREALRHPSLQSVVAVLSDDERNMVNVTREYLPSLLDCRRIVGSAAVDCFHDERVSTVVQDSLSWLQQQVFVLRNDSNNFCDIEDDGSQISSCEQPQELFDVIFMNMQEIQSGDESAGMLSFSESLKLVVASNGVVVFDLGRSPRAKAGTPTENVILDSLIEGLIEHQFAWWIIEEPSCTYSDEIRFYLVAFAGASDDLGRNISERRFFEEDAVKLDGWIEHRFEDSESEHLSLQFSAIDFVNTVKRGALRMQASHFEAR
mmetsp:Transcript_5655/g.8294  ORF Transcript_5655/g.8294 Transcript_5655/m.8294 type:complete len:936 (+) Transcript_5655:26-2833(+)